MPESPHTWAPGSTLLGGDIEYKRSKVNGEWVTWLAMTLRLTKTSSVTGRKHTVVEFFSHCGPASWFCPISALQKYTRVVHGNKRPTQLPLMRTETGKGYSARVFNNDLRELLSPIIDYQEGPGILSHSFRAGVAYTLARLGFSEDTIGAQGRWSSSCYERYVKLGRAQKLSVQRDVANALAEAAEAPTSTILVP